LRDPLAIGAATESNDDLDGTHSDERTTAPALGTRVSHLGSGKENTRPRAEEKTSPQRSERVASFPDRDWGEIHSDVDASAVPMTTLPVFQNEPLTDFTIASNRERMHSAIAKTRGELGRKFPLVIGGQSVWTQEEIVSINPARPSEVIGRVARA